MSLYSLNSNQVIEINKTIYFNCLRENEFRMKEQVTGPKKKTTNFLKKEKKRNNYIFTLVLDLQKKYTVTAVSMNCTSVSSIINNFYQYATFVMSNIKISL